MNFLQPLVVILTHASAQRYMDQLFPRDRSAVYGYCRTGIFDLVYFFEEQDFIQKNSKALSCK